MEKEEQLKDISTFGLNISWIVVIHLMTLHIDAAEGVRTRRIPSGIRLGAKNDPFKWD